MPLEWADLPQFTTGTHFRETKPNVVTLPQYFKQHGYHTQSVGKIYHGSPEAQDPESWSVPETLNVVWKRSDYLLPENQSPPADRWPGPKMSATEAADVFDNAYGDGQVVDHAVQILSEIKDRSVLFPGRWVSQASSSFQCPQKILGSL